MGSMKRQLQEFKISNLTTRGKKVQFGLASEN